MISRMRGSKKQQSAAGSNLSCMSCFPLLSSLVLFLAALWGVSMAVTARACQRLNQNEMMDGFRRH
jgi:predicted lysophospholipase L1 biosynthesis ABC-type transport system permease subunit